MFIPFYLLIIGINTSLCSDKVIYMFTEFPYKETNKNEVMFREIEAACESGCTVNMKKHTFQLEEGEVDVRLNSFKGCFIQRYNRSRP
ncbi:hypothetical protein ILUMI_12513 [Ignelater luminosus]|uniref:Uncharacterized protein n=1 Tax=Ignelater luminosus TaxID=2038154 RepID=A0A8K0CZE9_IGNLU|nr:hypothetical protein ILUMI_12513 [Ignelater luminosus]